MTDDFIMRFRLQQVLAYRELCRQSRSSGRGNVFFAGLMLTLAYYTFRPNAPIISILYAGLAFAELAVGLFKWMFPSAEGVLFDAILQLLFALFNLGWQALVFFLGAQNPNTLFVILGVLMLTGAIRRFKNYLDLRKAFADRPTSDQIRWFDDLIYEIRHADPSTDDQALDLPGKPPWKAKLLGTTAFFVAKKGSEVVIAGPFDFGLVPEDHHDGESHVRVRLHLYDRATKPFDLDDASWANYLKWMASHSNRAPS